MLVSSAICLLTRAPGRIEKGEQRSEKRGFISRPNVTLTDVTCLQFTSSLLGNSCAKWSGVGLRGRRWIRSYAEPPQSNNIHNKKHKINILVRRCRHFRWCLQCGGGNQGQRKRTRQLISSINNYFFPDFCFTDWTLQDLFKDMHISFIC